MCQATGVFTLTIAINAKGGLAIARACAMPCWVCNYETPTFIGAIGVTQMGASFGELGRRI